VIKKCLILSISIIFTSFSCEKEKKKMVQFAHQHSLPFIPQIPAVPEIPGRNQKLKAPIKDRWERCKDVFYDYTINRNLLLASGVSTFSGIFCLASDTCELGTPLTRGKIVATVATVIATTACCIGCLEMCMDCSDEYNKKDL